MDTIWKRLKIASELPEKVKKSVTSSTDFGLRHGLQLLRLKEQPEKQLELAEKFVEKPMTV